VAGHKPLPNQRSPELSQVYGAGETLIHMPKAPGIAAPCSIEIKHILEGHPFLHEKIQLLEVT